MGTIGSILVIIVLLIGLYYLYQYLYGSSLAPQKQQIISGVQDASPSQPITVSPTIQIPTSGGGEMSVEGWIYIQSYTQKFNMNKHIFSLGGTTFDTMRIYLAPTNSDLRVRVTSSIPGAASILSSATPSAYSDYLPATDNSTLFSTPQMDSLLANALPMCDIKALDLQRWIHFVVTLNNSSVDTYIDGKLSRSCVLPSFFKNDVTPTITLLNNNGFGGKVANFYLYSYALAPDQIYHNYMAGPTASSSIWQYVQSFFTASNVGNSTY